MASSSPSSRSREQRTWAIAYAAALLLPVLLMLVSPYTEQAWTVFAVAVGFTAFAGMALQVVLVSRSPLVARTIGLDVLVRLHRSMGTVLVIMVMLHVAVIFVVSPWARIWLWPIHQPLVAQAGAAAFYSMLLLGVTSIWRARFGMGYETWRLLHVVLTAVAVLGGYIHVLYASDFSWSGPIRILATLLLLTATASLVYLRVGRAFGTLDSPWLVADVRDERGDSVTLTLDATRRGVDVRPGQFAWLRFAGRPYSLVEHPFSIASASGRDRRRLTFTIRSLGSTSNAVRELRPGATVLLDGPHGGVADELLARPWILIVGGIGITPAMGILRSLAESGDRRPVQLVYCVRDWEQATFRDELVALGGQLDLDLVIVATRPVPAWTGVRGRLDGRTLARVLPADRATHEACWCAAPTGSLPTCSAGWMRSVCHSRTCTRNASRASDFDGSPQQRLHPRRLAPHVVRQRRRARREVRLRQQRRFAKPTLDVVGVSRVDEHARARRNELGWAADLRRHDAPLASHRFHQHLTKGFHEARQAQHVARAHPGDDLLVLDTADKSHAGSSLEVRSKRPVAHDREGAAADPLERVGERDDVLALVERADEQECGSVGRGAPPFAQARASILVQPRGEARLNVDAGVDHVNPTRELRHPTFQVVGQVPRDRDDPIRSRREHPHPARHASSFADVARIATVRDHHQPGSRTHSAGERGEHARRREEVGIDHLGAAQHDRCHRSDRESQVLGDSTASPGDRHDTHSMAARAQRLFLSTHEHAQVGGTGTGVHLRDDEDVETLVSHGASVPAGAPTFGPVAGWERLLDD